MNLLLVGVSPVRAAICKELLVRPANLSEVSELSALDGKIWGKLAANQEIIVSRIQTFKEGQFVAVDPVGSVKGFLNTMRIKRSALNAALNDKQNSTDAWSRVTDSAKIQATHDADGELLFLVNLTTDFDLNKQSEFRRRDIGSKLVNAALLFARSLDIKEVWGITRVNGFRKFALRHGLITLPEKQIAREEREEMKRYLELVAAGQEIDPALSFHLSLGAVVVAPQPHAMAEDSESLGWGALIRYAVDDAPIQDSR